MIQVHVNYQIMVNLVNKYFLFEKIYYICRYINKKKLNMKTKKILAESLNEFLNTPLIDGSNGSDINGTGKNLYVLAFIDTEDIEFSTIEFWKANDLDHLYDQVLDKLIQENPGDEEMVKNDLDSKWDYSILIKKFNF